MNRFRQGGIHSKMGATIGDQRIPMLGTSKFPETRPSLLATLADGPDGRPAWREFFDRYAPPIYRVARMRGLTHDDAEDIVQQTMISVSSHIGDFRYDRDRGRFRSWIRTIAENKIKSSWRRKSPKNLDTEMVNGVEDGSPSIDDIWEDEWRTQDLLWCLDQVEKDISPRKMQAFRKYTLEGVPAQEVARQMDMTVGNVYVTRHTVLNKIREKAAELSEIECEESA
ncbi:MAG: sigma-70 family RNA polymerase sigma factor [Phycisphaerales bacterium]